MTWEPGKQGPAEALGAILSIRVTVGDAAHRSVFRGPSHSLNPTWPRSPRQESGLSLLG